jgi:hypothetical protein
MSPDTRLVMTLPLIEPCSTLIILVKFYFFPSLQVPQSIKPQLTSNDDCVTYWTSPLQAC